MKEDRTYQEPTVVLAQVSLISCTGCSVHSAGVVEREANTEGEGGGAASEVHDGSA
jgi:hypothetical protein